MKKLIRFLYRVLIRLAILLFLTGAAIATVNTVRFSSRQIPVEAVVPFPVDADAPQRLAGAVRIPTVSVEQGPDTGAMLRLDSFIRRSFPLVDSLLDRMDAARPGIILRWPGRNPQLPPLLLMGHLDVVPVEKAALAAWTEAPFSGSIRDGFIWGRGTLDDKVNVMGVLEAVESLLREDYLPVRTVYLAFGHDEEVGGREGAKKIADFFRQQGLSFEYVLDEGQIIVEDALPGLGRPLAMIGVAEKGYVTLQMSIQLGEGGHSSMPPRETAIGALARAIRQLEEHPFPAKIDGATRALLDYAGPEMNLPYRLVFANLWLTEGLISRQFAADPASNALIRTTTAPTLFQGGVKDNVLPLEASASVNFRILPGETTRTVMDYVRRTIADPRIEVKEADANSQDPSPVSGTGTFGFQVIQKTVQEIFPGVVVAPALVIGATDSRHYQGVSQNIYRFTPVKLRREDLPRFHGLDERISTENYDQAIRFYRQLILNSCK